MTTENGGGGETVQLERDAAYVAQSASDELWLKSNVVLDLDGATLKLADGLNDSAPENGLVNFDNSSLTVNAHVRNGEVDGNLSNNSSFTGRAHRHGVNIHYVRTENGSAVSGTRPKRCTIENIHAHDTIASNVNVSGENCTARNLWLENSGNDHWLYMPSPIDCHVENVWCSGFARSEGIVIGSFNDGGTTTATHSKKSGSETYLTHQRSAPIWSGLSRSETQTRGLGRGATTHFGTL